MSAEFNSRGQTMFCLWEASCQETHWYTPSVITHCTAMTSTAGTTIKHTHHLFTLWFTTDMGDISWTADIFSLSSFHCTILYYTKKANKHVFILLCRNLCTYFPHKVTRSIWALILFSTPQSKSTKPDGSWKLQAHLWGKASAVSAENLFSTMVRYRAGKVVLGLHVTVIN